MRLRRCAFDDPVETTGSMKASSWMKTVVSLRARRMNAVRIHWAENRVVNLVVRDPNGGWKSVLTASQLLVPNELLLPDSPLSTPAGT